MRWDAPAYLLTLGPPFWPDHQVKTGKGIFRAAPVTADLDLLFACSRLATRREPGGEAVEPDQPEPPRAIACERTSQAR